MLQDERQISDTRRGSQTITREQARSFLERVKRHPARFTSFISTKARPVRSDPIAGSMLRCAIAKLPVGQALPLSITFVRGFFALVREDSTRAGIIILHQPMK